MTTPPDPFAVPDAGSTPPPYEQPVGYGQQPTQYGQGSGMPPPYGTAPRAGRNGMGTAALVLGILALVGSVTVIFGVLFGIIAIVLGVIGRGRAKRQEATNGSSATAGLVCGILGLVLSAALVAAGVGFLHSDRGKNLQNCLESAGSDAAAQQKCQVEFKKTFGY